MSGALLDKPIYFKRSAEQADRNMRALQKLTDGTLVPGELFRLVAGDDPLHVIRGEGVSGSRRRSPGRCLDCSKQLSHDGLPLKSQPRRCLPCGRKKRQQHNAVQVQNTEAERAKKAEEPVEEPNPFA